MAHCEVKVAAERSTLSVQVVVGAGNGGQAVPLGANNAWPSTSQGRARAGVRRLCDEEHEEAVKLQPAPGRSRSQ
jgi:hypothetical protein